MSDAAAHPIWSCDSDAIKAEYRRVLEEAELWKNMHAKVEAEAERFQMVLEEVGRSAKRALK